LASLSADLKSTQRSQDAAIANLFSALTSDSRKLEKQSEKLSKEHKIIVSLRPSASFEAG
jgi:hypothetical protein